jgi:uncharacterized damage-inducible protein DinB
MHTELSNLREHLDRYRAVTLQTIDAAPDDAALDWRPTPESFSLGQQLAHIAQTEDYYTRGLFEGEWRPELLRFDTAPRGRAAVRTYFGQVRTRFAAHLDAMSATDLDAPRDAPDAPPGLTLRWWLWFVLEHEIHHKAQAAVYLRQMGLTAPFYALPLVLGERPDIAVRASMGGV